MIQSRPGNSASLLGIALLAIPLLFLFSTITVAPCSAKHHIPELYVVDGGGDEFPDGISPPCSPNLTKEMPNKPSSPESANANQLSRENVPHAPRSGLRHWIVYIVAFAGRLP